MKQVKILLTINLYELVLSHLDSFKKYVILWVVSLEET